MATIQFNLRVPEELKQKIDEASAESGRSINAEATYRLEQSFKETKPSLEDDEISRVALELIHYFHDNPNFYALLPKPNNKKPT